MESSDRLRLEQSKILIGEDVRDLAVSIEELDLRVINFCKEMAQLRQDVSAKLGRLERRHRTITALESKLNSKEKEGS